MKKIKKRFIVYGLIILLLYLTVLPAVRIFAELILQDYTTYTEVDSTSTMAVYQNKLDINAMNESAYGKIYKDFGNDYFQSDWEVKWKQTTYTLGTGHVMSAGLFSNTTPYNFTDYQNNTSTPDAIGMKFQKSSSNTQFYLFEKKQGTAISLSSALSIPESASPRYVKMWFDNDVGTYGTIYLAVYSDSGYSSQIGSTISKALTEENSWKYFSAFNNYGGGSTWANTVDIENHYVDAGIQFEIDTSGTPDSILYLPDSNQFEVTFTANTTENATTYVAWSYDEDTWYPVGLDWIGETTYTGRVFFDYEDEGETIYYYCFAWSDPDELYAETDEYSFTINRTEISLPYVISDEDVYVPYGGQDVVLRGYLFDDGGETCNVSITWWTDPESLHDVNLGTAQSLDEFYTTINMTVEGIPFYFHATANNSAGSTNGSDVFFIRFDASTPSILTTYPSDSIYYKDAYGQQLVKINLNGQVTDDGDAWCYAGFEIRRQGASTGWVRYLKGEDFVYTEGDNVTIQVTNLSPATVYEYRALITNNALRNPSTLVYTYVTGNTVAFSTAGLPTGLLAITLDSVTYWDNYTVIWNATVTNDGGYECGVGSQYRTPGGAWTLGGHGVHGITTGQTVQSYIDGLTYGQVYEIRAYALNENNETAYSNIISYQLRAPDDDETPTPGGSDLSKPIDDFLIQWNMYNDGGKLLVIIIAMLLVVVGLVFIPGNRWREHLNVTLPIAGIIDSLILIFGMVIRYVPVWVSIIIIVVFAGVVAGFFIKQFGVKAGGTA